MHLGSKQLEDLNDVIYSSPIHWQLPFPSEDVHPDLHSVITFQANCVVGRVREEIPEMVSCCADLGPSHITTEHGWLLLNNRQSACQHVGPRHPVHKAHEKYNTLQQHTSVWRDGSL